MQSKFSSFCLLKEDLREELTLFPKIDQVKSLRLGAAVKVCIETSLRPR